MLQIFNNEIYQAFLNKIGEGWFTPYNCNQFMDNGEYTICADLHEYGLLTRKKENGLWMFKKKH